VGSPFAGHDANAAGIAGPKLGPAGQGIAEKKAQKDIFFLKFSIVYIYTLFFFV